MLNFSLFLLGTSFSYFGSHLFVNALRVYVYLISNSLLGFGTVYILEYAVKALVAPISGVLIDKFNRKYIFILSDLIQFFCLFVVFIYLKNFNPGVNSFFLIIAIFSAVNAFLFPINKAIIPQIFSGDNMIRATALEISIERISRILVFPVALLFFVFKNQLETAILLSSILFLLSAIVKNFITVKEIKLNKVGLLSSIPSLMKGVFFNTDIRKAIVVSFLTEMVLGIFFSSITLILKTSYQGSSPELVSYIDSISTFDAGNFGLVIETLGWMFYILSPVILLVFVRMLEGTVFEQNLSDTEKRFFKYLHLPASFLLSMSFLHQIFFKIGSSCKFSLFSVKTETIEGSLNMFLMLSIGVGVFITLLFFQLFPWKYNPKKGMKLSLYLIVPLSFLISCVVIYFGILGKGDVIQLTFALTPLVIFLTLAMVGYNIFFTSFYQNQIPIGDLGKFSSFFYFLSILAKIIGMMLYRVLMNKYGLISMPIVFFLFTIGNVFSFRNLEKD